MNNLPRRKRNVREPRKGIRPQLRDEAMIYAVYTHGLIRNQHLELLFSGGKSIMKFRAGDILILSGEVAEVVGITYAQVTFETGDYKQGWVPEQDIERQSENEATVTAKITYVRERPGGSPQQISRRRLELSHHGIFVWVPEPFRRSLDLKPGSESYIYGLGDKGADYLADRTQYEIHRGRIRWDEKNKERGDAFVAHTLGVTDALVRVESACQAKPGVIFVSSDAVLALAPEATQKSRNPLRWEVSNTGSGRFEKFQDKMTADPDGLFGITRIVNGKRLSMYYVLEFDRRTEPIQRISEPQERTSVERKLVVYGLGGFQKIHEKRFNIPRFRVLIVTTGPKRVENICDYIEDHIEKIPGNIIYTTDVHSLRAAENAFSVRWTTFRRDESDGSVQRCQVTILE